LYAVIGCMMQRRAKIGEKNKKSSLIAIKEDYKGV
jgi:hypothetical protein